MTPFRKPKTPEYRLHKPTGQAYVRIGGRMHYLGRYDQAETKEKYHRLVAELLANNGELPVDPYQITIAELMAKFWVWAQGYYVYPDSGKPTYELTSIQQALRPLKRLYGSTRAAEFGPRALRATRQAMVSAGWSRRYVNQQVSRLKRMFRWASEGELIPPQVYHGLMAVSGLKAGRTEARETEGVRPVADAVVDATLPHLPPTVQTMVQVQRYTGMRPMEVCLMRTCDVDTSGAIWIYRPLYHKMAYKGRPRVVFIGPKAQRFLQPHLRPDLQAYIFSPAQAMAERLQARHAARMTPEHQGNRPGSNRVRRPDRQPGERYDTLGYNKAVTYACDQAFPPPAELASREGETLKDWRARLQAEGRLEALKAWRDEHRWHVGQLRHSFATMVRKQHGLQAAQVLLGHARADVTQVYAEIDEQQGLLLAGEIG